MCSIVLVKHSAHYLVARAIPGAINITAFVIYARLLSPREFGQYSLVIGAAGVLNFFLFHWLTLSVLRFLEANPDSRSTLLSTVRTSFAIVVLTSGAALVVVWLYIDSALTRQLMVVGALLLWFQAWFEIDTAIARADLSPVAYGVQTTLKAVIGMAAGVSLALGGWGPVGVLVGIAAGYALPSVLTGSRRWRGTPLINIDRQSLSQIVRYGTPLAIALTLGTVVTTSDRFLLAWMIGTDQTGVYTVGYDFSHQTLGLLMTVIHMAAFPLAVRAIRTSESEARNQIATNVTALLCIGLPAMTGLAVLAPSIATVLFEGEFAAAATKVIPIIAIAIFLSGMKVGHFDLAFQLKRKTAGLILVALLAAVTNLIFNVIWIPRYGIMGAAYATLLAYAVAVALSWWIGRRLFRLPPLWRPAMRLCGATLLMGATVWPFRTSGSITSLVLAIVAGTLVFSFMCITLNILNLRATIAGRGQRYIAAMLPRERPGEQADVDKVDETK